MRTFRSFQQGCPQLVLHGEHAGAGSGAAPLCQVAMGSMTQSDLSPEASQGVHIGAQLSIHAWWHAWDNKAGSQEQSTVRRPLKAHSSLRSNLC